MSRGGWRYGAGRPARHAKTKGKRALDVRALHRDGHLVAGQAIRWQWRDGATATLESSEDSALLAYRYLKRGQWHECNTAVRLTRTPCHYGGTRPWFACPRCGRRIAILYLSGSPACRTCCRLVYPSQSDDALARSWNRTRAILRRLGQSGEGVHAIPRRPKGMRQATFERLWQTWCEEGRRRDALAAAFVLRAGLL